MMQRVERMKKPNLELLLAEAFRQRGYAVEDVGGEGAEVGVDLVLVKDAGRYFVHCGQWKASSVDVDTVQELHEVVAARRAAGGFVVTSGRFTEDAATLARVHGLALIDGPKLVVMLDDANETITTGIRVPRPAR